MLSRPVQVLQTYPEFTWPRKHATPSQQEANKLAVDQRYQNLRRSFFVS